MRGKIVQLEDNEKLAGAETIDRIHKKAQRLQGLQEVRESQGSVKTKGG